MQPIPRVLSLPRTFTEALDRFPSYVDLAAELRVSRATISSWKRRDSVPYEYWEALAASAKALEVGGVTLRRLRTIAATRTAARRQQKGGSDARVSVG